jgi:UDP-N-acetylmuramoyl-tripeptide--D-alanyl-D-alanine ligase
MRFILSASFLFFSLRRLLTYLHIYQQEEYDSRRFLPWIIVHRAFDMRMSAALLVLGILQFAIVLSPVIAFAAAAVGFVILGAIEKDPRKASKKKLSMTGRAKRIYWVAFGALAVGTVLIAAAAARVWVWIIPVQLIPVALSVGNLFTQPYENKLQKRFWNEAHSKLASLKPTVVGITGSYGKTSTKHLLGHILEVQAPALITPGSVNTPMGIARIVRERLSSHHRFFVCEMGAYGPGSIERLCRLAPPDVAVITAIGMAHYERFKTLETVAKTKFELAEAVAERGGPVIVAQQVLEFEAAKRFRDGYQRTIVVGTDPECALRINASSQTTEGILAHVLWNGVAYVLRAPIFGEHHISNMAVAFAAACSLGAAPEDAILALASVPQISHRLEVKQGPAGARLIDDAYNSNPAGFASGLRLLDALSTDGGRRILVTPGMVELGQAHDEEHRKIGQMAGAHADLVLAVVPERIKTFTSAYRSANPSGTVMPFPTFTAANTWLASNVRSNDVVLLENDLPDLYEKKLRL